MDFKKMSLAELRNYAKEMGIRNISTLKKSELTQLLENVEKMTSKRVEVKKTETVAEEKKADERKTEEKKPVEKKPAERISESRTFESRKSEVKKSETRMTDTAKSEAPAEAARSEKMMTFDGQEYNAELDSGEQANGILEVMSDGYGFIRSANYLPGDKDIYVSPVQIRRFGLKKGDIIGGPIRMKTQGEKFSALLYIKHVNGYKPSEAAKRVSFEELTPVFPNERISLDTAGAPVAIRIVDLLSPIGK